MGKIGTVEWLLVVAPVLLLFVYTLVRQIRSERANAAIRDSAVEAGLTEPPSLHPVIDEVQCIGCAACVEACPEQNVLGLIDGKAVLLEPTHCIGHGACKPACPTDAIMLVFGTEKRGLDIPHVSPNFETNVPGIFIAGELGGMGLIRNAVEQGRQAIDSIRRLDGIGNSVPHDVVIVGAGPAGFAASLAAKEHGLRAVTVEQDSLGGTVAHYPRGKVVMTAPAVLPLAGKMKFTETTKEELLRYWQNVERSTGLQISYGERLEDVKPTSPGFEITTNRQTYRAHALLLTIGRRGTPRKLGVSGEDRSKVTYRMIDPEQYREKHVLVVGGGDSALEAATSIAEQPGTTVALSYRSGAFSRAKVKNRQRVTEAESAGGLSVFLSSNVKSIGDDHVIVEHEERLLRLPNDAVIICAGGVLPTPFLEKLGITIETKHGTA